MLAQHCSHLESLDLYSIEDQTLIEELLPSWPHLTKYSFLRADSSNDDDVIRIVQKSPSLKTLCLDIYEGSSRRITPEVIHKLAALNRPFTLEIRQWFAYKANQAQREALLRHYPHIKIVMKEPFLKVDG